MVSKHIAEAYEESRARCPAAPSSSSPEQELVAKLVEALRVIAIALKEPAGGEYHSARRLADEWGIYNDDLEGNRVLLRIAETALAEYRKEKL